MFNKETEIQRKQIQNCKSQSSLQSQEQSRGVYCGQVPLAEKTLAQKNADFIAQLLSSKRFTWHQEFQANLSITVLETNFESMSALLHYGNFEIQIYIIFTNLEENLFRDIQTESGSFGVVRFCLFQNLSYAVKWIKINEKSSEADFESLYREYFLCCMADALEVGPKMERLFGYDIVVSKGSGFFSMEKCLCVQGQKQGIESDLLDNIKKMHAAKFIHSDIKPRNFAYSPHFRKHVFIDFGLSKLIKQVPGQKTKTSFSGTLSYCNEEMRKCCILNKLMWVDLYENDQFCLGKTLKWIKSLEKFNTFRQQIDSENQTDYNFLEDLGLILRLKFYIQTENCQEVLKVVENSRNFPRSVYQVLLNSSVPKSIQKNPEIQEKISKIRNFIYNSKGNELLQTDSILCTAFSPENKKASSEKIIPISHLLSLEKNSLRDALSKVQIVYKLFIFLDPFSQRVKVKEQNHNLKMLLIVKIYQIGCQNPKESTFFSQKLRSTLIFFYDNLKGLRNFKVMVSLRMMFISIEDWSYVEKLEDEIIECTQTPVLKMLKMAEFSLFWDVLLEDFDHRRKEKWRKIVENTLISQNHTVQVKTKALFSSLTIQNKYFSYQYSLKKSVMNKMMEISRELSSDQQKQSLYSITYIYSQLSNIHFSHYTSAPSGLTVAIYSRFFSLFYVELQEFQQANSYIFASLYTQFSYYFNLNPSKDLALKAIQSQFQISKEKSQFMSLKFVKFISSGSVYKECLFELLQKTLKLIQGNNQYKTNYNLFNHLMLLQHFFLSIKQNKQKAVGDEKISKKEEKIILDQIKSIYTKIANEKRVQEILQESQELKVEAMIVEADQGFWMNRGEEEMKQLIQGIVSLLGSLPNLSLNFVVYFTNLFQYLGFNLNEKLDKYLNNILFHFADSYISKNEFYLFERVSPFLGDYLAIKSQRGETDNLHIILSLIENYREGRQYYADGSHNFAMIYAIERFRRTLTIEKLQQEYDKIKDKLVEITCGLYGFLVFQIFFPLQRMLGLATRRRQVVRTTLCLPKMARICQRQIKAQLFQSSRALNLFRSERKSAIFSRLEGKLLDCQMVQSLKFKTAKKPKNSTTQKVIEDMYLKLKKYNPQTVSKHRIKFKLES